LNAPPCCTLHGMNFPRTGLILWVMSTRRRKQKSVQHVTMPVPTASRQSFGKRLLVGAGFVASLSTALYTGAYGLEKWNETLLAIDLSGDADQKKPFTLPISLPNPSGLFTASTPLVICHFQVLLEDSKDARATESGHDQAIHLPDILPGHNEVYSCGQPDKFVVRRQDDGSVVPVKIAYMQVYISYKTWLLGIWPISRLVPERFTLFPTSSGYRWVKGQYAP
jgi:hypothetical protein